MNKTTTRRPELQTISRERVSYEFIPVPEQIEREINSPILERLWRIILGFIRKGVNDPSLRQLAKRMRRSVRTVQRCIAKLKQLGFLVSTERRVESDRNLTNVFSIPNLDRGVGDINVTEKKREILKTNTPAPSRGVISKLREFWERRFSQDRKDSAWRRAEYEHRAKVWEEAKRQRAERSVCNLFNPVSIVTPDTEADRAWIVDWRKRHGLEES